jgi:predicted PurR-regulated permease PerM
VQAASRRALGWIALLLCAAVLLALRPVAVPLVLAAWFATLVRPAHERLSRALGGRQLAAALITAGLVVALGAIIGLLYAILGSGAMGLADALSRAEGPKAALEALVTPGDDRPGNPASLQKLAEAHGEEAASVLKYTALLGLGTLLFLFFLGLGTAGLLAEGKRLYAWLRASAPVRPDQFDRLGEAFTETGRGLFFYIGLTCLTQGVLCSVTFVALGVPRPLVLGFVCSLFAILPVVGTPLVWLPVAGGLFIVGAAAKAVILLVVGGGVIGAVEFVIGPMFSKLGRLRLDPALLMLAMFGGALGLGPSGLILGPLILRLAKEAVDAWRADAEAVAPPR